MFPMSLNWLYKLLSYILHPVIAPLTATIIYLSVFFNNTIYQEKVIVMALVFVTTYILPIIVILILIKFKIVKTMYLSERKERSIPIIATALFAIIGAKYLDNLEIGLPVVLYLRGSVISLLIILIFLNKIKISLHSSAFASITGFILYLSCSYYINLNSLLAISIIIVGVISTSRTKLKVHTISETVLGIIVGLVPQTFMIGLY